MCCISYKLQLLPQAADHVPLYHPVTYNSHLMRLIHYLKRLYIYKKLKKSKSAIPSCSRYLARVIIQVTFKFMEHYIFTECDMHL